MSDPPPVAAPNATASSPPQPPALIAADLLVQNEQNKLVATALNTGGVGIILAGVFAPLVGALNGTALPTADHPWI